MGHGHSIPLRGEKVLREEDFYFPILGSRQSRPFFKIRVDLLLNQLARPRGEPLAHFVAEKPSGAPVIAPSDGVGIGGSIYLGQTLSEKRGQQGGIVPRQSGDVR